MLTQTRLKEVLSYNPCTGEFRWLQQLNGRVPAGSLAGCTDSKGYVWIKIDRKRYGAHRLAIFYMTGVLPRMADHRDRNPGNNRYTNLRPATKSQNGGNGLWPVGVSGLRGVTLNRGRWCARIRVNNEKRHLGMFDTAEEAHAAYMAAAKKHHGEFALKEWN